VCAHLVLDVAASATFSEQVFQHIRMAANGRPPAAIAFALHVYHLIYFFSGFIPALSVKDATG